jgi:AraC-like DNA-binding protein
MGPIFRRRNGQIAPVTVLFESLMVSGAERRYLSTPQDPSSFASFPCPKRVWSHLDKCVQHTSVVPVSAVAWKCNADWALIDQANPDSYLTYVASGSGKGWFSGDEAAFRITPGDLVLVPERLIHTVLPDEGASLRLINVHFLARFNELADTLRILGLRGCYPGTPDAPFASATAEMARSFALRAPGWEKEMEAQIWRILLYLIRHYVSDNPSSVYSVLSATVSRILPALDVVEEHLSDPGLRVETLAASVNLSEVHLRSLFRAATGKSPQGFIRQKRIDRACRLLRTTGCTVEDIARSSGFRSAEYFYRVFRTETGKTPQQYRDTVRM